MELKKIWKWIIKDLWTVRKCRFLGYATYNKRKNTVLDTRLTKDCARQTCNKLNNRREGIMPKAFINGKRTKSGRPYYSLMEMSAAAGLPVYDGGPADVVFNWGGGGKPAPAKAVVLNRHPIFDKYYQAKAMFKAGVNTPKPNLSIQNVKKFPVVRKPRNSYGGHGITLVKSSNFSDKGNFWYQGFIKKDREFRVYFFNDRICMIEEKFAKDKSKLTWNLCNCEKWHRCKEMEGSKIVRDLVIPAAKAIRIDWGAADVLQDMEGKLWIGEINSRPSCWGGQKPKLKMQVKNGIYKLIENERKDLDLSARMWANRMKRFLNEY